MATVTTDFGPFSSDGKRRYMTFNPEISMGNLLTIIALVGSGLTAFYSLKEVQSNQQIQIEALKSADIQMTARGNERYADLKGDIKDLKAAVSEMSVSIAVVRGATANNQQPIRQPYSR